MEKELEILLIWLNWLTDWQRLRSNIWIKFSNSIKRGDLTLFWWFEEQIYFWYLDEQAEKITKKFVKEKLLSIVEISDARFIVLMIQKYKWKEPAIVWIDLANKINPKITRFSIDTKWTFNLEENKPIYKNRTLIEQLIELSKDLWWWERTLKVRYLKKFFEKQSLTEKFYEVYKTELFDKIKNDLIKKFWKENEENINNFVLVNLNRLLFIHFLDRKGTVFKNYDRDRYWSYISYLFHKVHKDLNSKEQFYNSVLKPLFFETFNKPYSQRNYNNLLLKSEFWDLPYLNWWLFKQSKYEKDSFYIDNAFIKSFILNIIDAYNFTIKEDTPFDVKVSVDPELLWYIFENLIQEYDNSQTDEKAWKSKKKSERNDSWVFYTPKIEVDFMCRQVLIEYLAKKEELKNKKLDLYKLFYDEKWWADNQEYWSFSDREIWMIFYYLEKLKVVDPACGSWAFLVWMMQVIMDVEDNLIESNIETIKKSQNERLKEYLRTKLNPFKRKKDLIKNSLYWVDIKSWAVEIAKLRLWLSMIIDVKEESFKNENAKNEPLLPSFWFHIVQWDSLVNRIWDKLIPINVARKDILDPKTREKIETLVDLKNKFYDNEKIEIKTESTWNSLLWWWSIKMDEQYIKSQEKEIYEEMISNKISYFKREITKLENQKNQKTWWFNSTLFGSAEFWWWFVDEKANNKRIDKEIEEYNIQIESLQKQLWEIKWTWTVPFSWWIDFADVFTEREWFDVVVWNPPYVRQEEIADATWKITDKKDILWDVANQDWFNDIKKYQKDELKIWWRADLYIYFYFRWLKLLNPQWVFTFITSNSRLDVDFWAILQEFLIKYCPSIKIFDNQVQRSFASAQINTIMCFFDKPVINTKDTKQWKAQFINFKKSYEESTRSEVLAELDNQVINTEFFSREIKIWDINFLQRECEELRVIDITAIDLWNDGSSEEDDSLWIWIKEYVWGKWWWKYLKAPEIFFNILYKYNNKLTEFQNLADIVGWIITWDNKKYYSERTKDYDKSKYSLVFKSPREVKKIQIISDDAKSLVQIKDVSYNIKTAKLLWVDLRWDKHICHINKENLPFEHNFYWINPKKEKIDDESFSLIINSTFMWLMIEIFWRKWLWWWAIRLVKLDILRLIMPNVKVLNFKYKGEFLNRSVKSIFEEIWINPLNDIRSQTPNPLPDRKELDDIVFDELWLTQDERNEVYRSLAELVQNRLNKAKSV